MCFLSFLNTLDQSLQIEYNMQPIGSISRVVGNLYESLFEFGL